MDNLEIWGDKSRIVKTRKAHHCNACEKPIEKSESALTIKNTPMHGDDGFSTWYFHLPCAEVIEADMNSMRLGDTIDELELVGLYAHLTS